MRLFSWHLFSSRWILLFCLARLHGIKGFSNFEVGTVTSFICSSSGTRECWRKRNLLRLYQGKGFTNDDSDTTPIRLTTKAPNPFGKAARLHDFISRPIHWPEIVASSNDVQPSEKRYSQDLVYEPLKVGQTVEEIFALGLWSIAWTCVETSSISSSKKNMLFRVESSDGVPGLASDCSMVFDICDNSLEFEMSYSPKSIVAYLATPMLVLDNWFALNVLLPVATDPRPLDSFRRLMGCLYGFAGLAHAADLIVGDSAILALAGLPAFSELPLEGKVYATIWCVMGPVAYILSTGSPVSETEEVGHSLTLAELGLGMYGFIEIVGASLSGDPGASQNAIGVQVVVFAAWIFSYQKQRGRELQNSSS